MEKARKSGSLEPFTLVCSCKHCTSASSRPSTWPYRSAQTWRPNWDSPRLRWAFTKSTRLKKKSSGVIFYILHPKIREELKETQKRTPLISCVIEDHEDQVWATVLWFATRSLNARLIDGAHFLCWDTSLENLSMNESRPQKNHQEKYKKQPLRLHLFREISVEYYYNWIESFVESDKFNWIKKQSDNYLIKPNYRSIIRILIVSAIILGPA